jgi:hypothetical protein
MTDTPIRNWLTELKDLYDDIETQGPASAEAIAFASESVGALPPELADFYSVSNGLECRSFRLLPVLDQSMRKTLRKTWNSIQRANAPATAEALGRDEGLLSRFLVFADIGDGYAFFDRRTGKIWFEELGQDEVSETELTFREFVELMVKNAE